jgi:hypothetical protein
MAGATTQDSLLSSTVTLLLNEALSTKRTLGCHEARLKALEEARASGATSSPTRLSKWTPPNLKSFAKILETIVTAMRIVGPILVYLGPWLALIGAALWKWLLPYVGRLVGL